ncbi:mas-related G-protein coupled receptor member B1-like [Pipra filicauda]|uniref:Mas-related G-protein coupled receptor member B1-like n=1 Tax=Pipra filicauda TaxID=649802 RepID=A0A6J2GT15_9PASS|nr:mas-related G-protein coupled receptor member B1-like [Pipra filicauda]
MEESDTRNLTLNMTYGSLDIEEFINDTCSIVSYKLIVFGSVCLGISLCGLVGNGMVMWFLGFHMKQSPFTVYILNLAVADFSLILMFFLILVVFFILVTFCTSLIELAPLYTDFVFVVGFLCHVFDLSSLGLLTALSVERCVSVLFPIWYRCHRPRHLSGIVSGTLWALAGVFVSLLYFTLTKDSEEVLSDVALAFSMILSVLMLFSNLFLITKLLCGSQRRHPGRLYVAVLIEVIVFFALGIPFCLEIFLNSDEIFPDNTSLLLALLDCCLNPVIYVLVGSCRRRRFHRSVKVALRRAFEEKAGNEERSHVCWDTVVEVTSL